MGDGGGTCAFLIQTATMFALNSPGSLKSLHRFVVRREGSNELRPVSERVERACLMREVGLKSIGLIGTPKAINNLAALRAMVDEDAECAAAMPNEPRRYVSVSLTQRYQPGRMGPCEKRGLHGVGGHLPGKGEASARCAGAFAP